MDFEDKRDKNSCWFKLYKNIFSGSTNKTKIQEFIKQNQKQRAIVRANSSLMNRSSLMSLQLEKMKVHYTD